MRELQGTFHAEASTYYTQTVANEAQRTCRVFKDSES